MHNKQQKCLEYTDLVAQSTTINTRENARHKKWSSVNKPSTTLGSQTIKSKSGKINMKSFSRAKVNELPCCLAAAVVNQHSSNIATITEMLQENRSNNNKLISHTKADRMLR